ncbi:hypothetical protein [uncultured Rhodospira sp.]|uniref:hypothetical protein n=1 Tax=uncultured Rhodospira sp. TaxID=1936189 RepID=UPI0026362E4B|nr:hypothetical protein [uncultured Rhodospira sp.]
MVLDLFSHNVVGWAKRDLFASIEGYYNRRRLHSALGYITPEQAERRAAQTGVHFFGVRSTVGSPWRCT